MSFLNKETLERRASLTCFLAECVTDAMTKQRWGKDKFNVAAAGTVLSVATLTLDVSVAIANFIKKRA